jgi:Uma2 family endonuclease
METPYHDLIEDYQSEDIMSLNHSRTIQRISAHFEQFDNDYDTFPELELKLNGKPVKPDISVFPNLPEDWNSDIIFFTEPPIIAIEVLSPKQALSEITDKVNTIYFPAGVKSIWIIVPLLQTVFIRTPDGGKWTFTDGIIKDPVTEIDIPFSKIFRTTSI